MQLLDHVSITVARLDAARPFYDAVMLALGAPRSCWTPTTIASKRSAMLMNDPG